MAAMREMPERSRSAADLAAWRDGLLGRKRVVTALFTNSRRGIAIIAA